MTVIRKNPSLELKTAPRIALDASGWRSEGNYPTVFDSFRKAKRSGTTGRRRRYLPKILPWGKDVFGMKTYVGFRVLNRGCVVYVKPSEGEIYELAPRLDLCNYSPTGFEWGSSGSGPAQLALALAADALGNDVAAEQVHQQLKFHLVAGGLRRNFWVLTEEYLLYLIENISKKFLSSYLGDEQVLGSCE